MPDPANFAHDLPRSFLPEDHILALNVAPLLYEASPTSGRHTASRAEDLSGKDYALKYHDGFELWCQHKRRNKRRSHGNMLFELASLDQDYQTPKARLGIAREILSGNYDGRLGWSLKLPTSDYTIYHYALLGTATVAPSWCLYQALQDNKLEWLRRARRGDEGFEVPPLTHNRPQHGPDYWTLNLAIPNASLGPAVVRTTHSFDTPSDDLRYFYYRPSPQEAAQCQTRQEDR